MFEIGEKVVCIHNFKEEGHNPKKGEIVTIIEFDTEGELCLVLDGYYFDVDGEPQSFYFKCFRKLDHQFAEDLLEEITKQVKEEQKVLVTLA